MKHDAIVEQGIPILERVPIPEELIPEDSRVEIDAKIHAGYCKTTEPRTVLISDYEVGPLTRKHSHYWKEVNGRRASPCTRSTLG